MELLRQYDEYMQMLYPVGSEHLDRIEDLRGPGTAFFGCRLDGGTIACGAVRVIEDEDEPYGEIMRLFVDKSHRGQGLASAVMKRLEQYLLDQGIRTARLVVGLRQPGAQGLYEKLNYHERPPYDGYVDDGLSLFMEKRLQG